MFIHFDNIVLIQFKHLNCYIDDLFLLFKQEFSKCTAEIYLKENQILTFNNCPFLDFDISLLHQKLYTPKNMTKQMILFPCFGSLCLFHTVLRWLYIPVRSLCPCLNVLQSVYYYSILKSGVYLPQVTLIFMTFFHIYKYSACKFVWYPEKNWLQTEYASLILR